MMQDVATAKSDIAAFATGLSVNSSQKSESNEQFGQLLQDQSAQQSLPQTVNKNNKQNPLDNNATLHDKSKESAPNEPNKLPTADSIDAKHQVALKDVKNTVKEMSNTDTKLKQPAVESATKQDSSSGKNNALALHVTQELALSNAPDGDLLSLNAEVQNAKAKLKLELPENQLNEEIKQPTSSHNNVVAEEWLALVESYQKLADIAQATEKQTSKDQPVILDLEKVQAENIDKSLLKQIAQEQIIYQTGNPIAAAEPEVTSAYNVSLVPTGYQDPKLINVQVMNTPVVDLVVTDKTSLKANQTELPQSNVALLVEKALEKLTITTEASEVSSEKLPQQTAELLLTDPQLLKSIQKELATVGHEIEGGEEVAKQQLMANTELLQSLITDSETPANKVDAIVVLDTDTIKPTALAKNSELVAENTPSDVKTPELAVTAIVADEFQIEAELTQITQSLIAPVAERNSADNAKKASDISLLIALPDKKLTKFLEHIAGRIMPNSSAADVMPSDQDISKFAPQLVVPKTADIPVATDNSAKEFISALKSGIEEFKQQVAQGREPGFDLKSLITDAMAKSNEAATSKSNVNVQQISQSISQVLDMAQSINRAIEQHQEQAYSAVQRDVAQIQGEQSKSLQFNQFEAKFEKAVNITKPEGHQQLAEKVRWMVNTKNLVADIRLDPAELGSVHVKVAMSGESATVNFVVQSQHARDAMDNATPKLREMLAEKGIELGQSSVEQESKGQSSQDEGQLSQHGSQNQQLDSELELTDQVIAQQPIVNGALGGIDYFV